MDRDIIDIEPSVPEHNLPVATEVSGQKPSLARSDADVGFVSQLLAARAHLAPQRKKRRAAVGTALDAYQTSADSAVRRLPPGYRKTVDV